MSRYQSHINTAVKIIESYKGDKPFASFIKIFFSENKKYGSKDRKEISSLCYNYFRLGFSVISYSIEDKIILSCFLCGNEPTDLLAYKNPEWNNNMHLPVKQKAALIGEIFSFTAIFPFVDKLSEGIDVERFCQSFLIQPDLFVRIRPKEKATVIKKLESSALNYTLVNDDCIAFANGTKTADLFKADKEVVIQDYNSQQVFAYLKTYFNADSNLKPTVWDCCAASGGKSILLFDILHGKLELMVSDIRPAILANLQQRFEIAGIKSYKSIVADISNAATIKNPPVEQDVILCDVPCTGSGTWGRTPEQLCFFKQSEIDRFNSKQKQIVTNVIPYLKSGGLLVYITCSVFKKENEEVVNSLQEKFQLQLLHQELLKGYDRKADSMFVAILQKK